MFDIRVLFRAIRLASWCYLFLVVLLWLTMLIGGDCWWPATVILFAPRWVVALPLVVLLPLAGWHSRYNLIPLLAGALIVFGPFMGFNLPFGKTEAVDGKTLRVLTCNIANGKCNLEALSTLIAESQTDIVALQECPRDMAAALKLPSGWKHIQESDLAVLSQFPLRRVSLVSVTDPTHSWPRGCGLQVIVEAPDQSLVFSSVHLTSPRYGLQHLLDRHTLVNLSRKELLIEETRRRWQSSRSVQQAVASQKLPVIVAGDFNMPTTSSIYRELWKGYSNAFSIAGLGYGWTERADVRGIPVRVRIDHILAGNDLAVRVCAVGPDLGSDHLPLIADIEVVKR